MIEPDFLICCNESILPIDSIFQSNQIDISPFGNNFSLNRRDIAIDIPCLFSICKGIKLEHPEFEMEEKRERNEFTDEEETVIYYTMPVVNENRRDVCMDYIKMRYEAITTKMEVVFTAHSTKIAAKMIGANAENIDAVKEKMQEIYDWHTNLCKEFRTDKEKEVEEAYQEYLKIVTEQKQQTEEKEAAQGTDTMFSMKMNDEE